MILEEIAAKTRVRVKEMKQHVPLQEVKKKISAGKSRKGDFAFEEALKGEELAFICEVKKASPSKGVIAREFPYRSIAEDYEAAGAAAISCLTEPFYFLGKDAYLKEIAEAVSIPVLRKDFTVDEYQIYEAAALGADAVLLICSLLSLEELNRFREIADSLGLSCLVEAHDEREVTAALEASARIIGVNNRNLRTFQVDVQNSVRLRRLVPRDVLFVSESGVQSPENIKVLLENRTDAVLIGETLMRAKDKKAQLDILRGGRPLVKD